MKIGSLCSGYGGLDLAVQAVFGGEVAWVADNDPGASAILAHRFPGIPNLGDIAAADWSTQAAVDVMCMGFPCTNVSCAGDREGIRAGNASGVWAHCAQAIDAMRPGLIVIENVRGLLSARADSNVESCAWCMGDRSDRPVLRALGAVLGDLASIGFDAEWTCLRASDVGAPHPRQRVFILAWPASEGAPADTLGVAAQRRGIAGVLGRPQREAAGVVVEREAPEREWQRDGDAAADSHQAPSADPDGATGGERRVAAPGQAEGRGAWPDAGGRDGAPAGGGGIRWGDYAPAIARWESVLGRPAPPPNEPGRTGERLSPRFVEWMMGLPEGWVTGVPGLTRSQQLRALGNGVVPQQASAACRLLLDRACATAVAA